MITRRQVILTILLVLLSSSTAFPQGESRHSGISALESASLQSYFPLSIGNEWVYYYADIGVTDTIPKVLYRVSDTVSVDGKTYFAYGEYRYGDGEDPGLTEYYHPDSSGHVFRYIAGDEILWLDFNAAAGDTYQVDIPIWDMQYHYNVTVGRNETVQNRAGRFENCVSFAFDDPYQDDDSFKLYFAENVGIVKRIFPHMIILQLYSAEVDGKTYPEIVTSVESANNDTHPDHSFPVQNYPNPLSPQEVVLLNNYPNPFNPQTTISFTLSKPAFVSLEIYSILGQRMKSLAEGFRQGGTYSVTWDGRNKNGRETASGVYLCRLVVDKGEFVRTRKLLLIR